MVVGREDDMLLMGFLLVLVLLLLLLLLLEVGVDRKGVLNRRHTLRKKFPGRSATGPGLAPEPGLGSASGSGLRLSPYRGSSPCPCAISRVISPSPPDPDLLNERPRGGRPIVV